MKGVMHSSWIWFLAFALNTSNVYRHFKFYRILLLYQKSTSLIAYYKRVKIASSYFGGCWLVLGCGFSWKMSPSFLIGYKNPIENYDILMVILLAWMNVML